MTMIIFLCLHYLLGTAWEWDLNQLWVSLGIFLGRHKLGRWVHMFLTVKKMRNNFTRAPVSLFASGLVFRDYLSGN